jgi:hypothetical protein
MPTKSKGNKPTDDKVSSDGFPEFSKHVLILLSNLPQEKFLDLVDFLILEDGEIHLSDEVVTSLINTIKLLDPTDVPNSLIESLFSIVEDSCCRSFEDYETQNAAALVLIKLSLTDKQIKQRLLEAVAAFINDNNENDDLGPIIDLLVDLTKQ